MKFEATSCFFNLVSRCSLDEVQKLVSANILEHLLANFTEDHAKLLKTTLETLYHVLLKGDELKDQYDGMNPYVYRVASSNGIHLIENLQNIKDQDIYNKVNRLMDAFFHTENVVNTGF